jgi:uncharacterized repeat protein (TIGR01451 family)
VKQVILSRTYNLGLADGSTKWATLRGGGVGIAWAQTSATFIEQRTHPWSVAGSFKNFYCRMFAPPQNAASISWTDTTYTLYKNGVATALAVTVPAAGPVSGNDFASASSNISDSVSVSPGDSLTVARTPGETISGILNGASANMMWSITFESTNTGESGYGSGGIGLLNNANQYCCAPFNGDGTAFVASSDAITDTTSHSIVPVAGSLFRLDVRLDPAPGAGQSQTFVCAVNGVQQDGTGGTPNTTLVVSGTSTTGASTFDLPLIPLDRLSVYKLVPVSSPVQSTISVSVGFRASVDGQSCLCFDSHGASPSALGLTDIVASENTGFSQSTANSPEPSIPPNPRWPADESLIWLPGGIDPFNLSGYCINIGSSPGASKHLVYTTRKSGVQVAPTLDMTGASGTSSVLQQDNAGNVDFAAVSDYLDMDCVASNTPNSSAVGWAWLMTTGTAGTPHLTVLKSHVDPFYQGQNGAIFTIDVSNTGDAPTVGTQTITDTLPADFTLVSMSGTGWSCIANVCSRSDVLAAGDSYPPITVVVNVSPTATTPQTNLANDTPDIVIVNAPRLGYRYIMKVAPEKRGASPRPDLPPYRIMRIPGSDQ